MKPRVKVGIIGCGLMGKETASAFSRWFMLKDSPVLPQIVAVSDLDPKALDWFRQVPGVVKFATDYREILNSIDVDVVYVAVPHDLHHQIYSDVMAAGKDLFAEKPFGIDQASARDLLAQCKTSGRFVRCSSEFPFYPGAQFVYDFLKSEDLGTLIQLDSAFLHSSDLDSNKPINWKRQVATCGEAGVMNDLGLHVAHLPFRLGHMPQTIFAQLQDIVKVRKNKEGVDVPCDTWDNATLHGSTYCGAPLRLQVKRLAPGEVNTWSIEVQGTRAGARFSTKNPKTVQLFKNGRWERMDVGHKCLFPVETGAIFEFGFPDAMLQMWAAFFAERAGELGSRFSCATPLEATRSHDLWSAALRSNLTQCAERVDYVD